MNPHKKFINTFRHSLEKVSSPEVAKSAARFSPGGLKNVGVTASNIRLILKDFHVKQPDLTADEVLALAEEILKTPKYSEEVFIGFGLLDKFVKKNYDESLLLRFEYWLEHYSYSWDHVDVLCIKTIYLFLMARPHLIETTQHWSKSKVSWCRRASNVVWVKFIKRKIGKSEYCLNTRLVFENCDTLIADEDFYVQKSIGWLLKVTAVHHQAEVIDYLKHNHQAMQRSTIRYALEKIDKDLRQGLLRTFKH